MAISKMKKVTILSSKSNERPLMKLMQNLQNIEIISSIKDLSEEDDALLRSIQVSESDGSKEEREQLEKLLAYVQTCVAYLMPHIPKKNHALQTEQTLVEFEDTIQRQQVEALVGKIRDIQHKENQLTEEREELKAKELIYEKWQSLDTNPQAVHDLSYTTTAMGDFSLSVKTPLLKELAELPTVKVQLVYESQTRGYLLVVFLREQTNFVTELLNKHSFNWLNYQEDQSPKMIYQETQKKLAQLANEKEMINAELKMFEVELRDLKKAEEALLSQIERAEASRWLGIFGRFLVIRGWIQADRVDQFDRQIEGISNSQQPVVVVYEEAKKGQEVPTALKNNALVRPFEMITEMYSLPKYGELDPTPLLTPFYLVFFGMMVADVGYGVLMLLATTLIKKLSLVRRSGRTFMDLLQILSVPVMLWGLIYGSFFGASLPFHLLSTTEDMNMILIISVIFGFIQLLVGLMINGFQLVKKKEYLKSISEGFAWQGILISVVMLVIANIVYKNQLLSTIGIGSFVLCALLIIFIPMILNSSKGKGLAQGAYAFYGITGYIGDLVSYTRLMALGISGGSIAGAFNMLVGFMPPIARFSVGLVLLVLLHALNIFLSLLSAYVHGARLQYVEYFGKFFQGGGKKFTPLKPKEKYLDFKVNDKN